MKRNTKPFSVEIKKSRVHGQIHQLPPRRLFEPTPVEPSEIVQKEELPTTAEIAPAPRILPSIVEPVWSNSDPVRRAPSSKQNTREQIELDLSAAPSEAPVEAHSAVPMIAEAVSQADIPDAGEGTRPSMRFTPCWVIVRRRSASLGRREPELLDR
jgi:hypothetical protein